MLKLIIADDEEIIRDRLINKIPWNTYGFEIVGEAENGKDLYEMTHLLRPDAVMLDICYQIESDIPLISAMENIMISNFNVSSNLHKNLPNIIPIIQNNIHRGIILLLLL